jgi:hypothetical protein
MIPIWRALLRYVPLSRVATVQGLVGFLLLTGCSGKDGGEMEHRSEKISVIVEFEVGDSDGEVIRERVTSKLKALMLEEDLTTLRSFAILPVVSLTIPIFQLGDISMIEGVKSISRNEEMSLYSPLSVPQQ